MSSETKEKGKAMDKKDEIRDYLNNNHIAAAMPSG